MSTASARASGQSRLGVPPEKAYNELVFHNKEYCSRCHRRIRSYDNYRPDVGFGGVSKHAPTERFRRAGEGSHGYRHETVDSVEVADGVTMDVRPMHRPATYCDECGSQGGRADSQTLSMGDALDAARYLVAALEEQGISIDHGALFYVVKNGKSRESLQGFDSEIFEEATALAIRVGRRR